MSSKTLLNESQIRQFMKLAKLEPLAPGFVEGLKETHGRGVGRQAPGSGNDPAYDGRVKVAEADVPPGEELEFATDDLEGGSPAEDIEADVDIETAEEEEGEGEEGRLVSVDDFLDALETALEAVIGDEVEIDSDELEDVEDVEDVDVEGPLDVDVEEEEEVELQEGDEEEVEEGKSAEATDELVEQITKRVAARILKSALAKK